MQDLMTTIKEANAAIKEKCKGLSEEERLKKFFSTEESIKVLFNPFFEKQNEVSDLAYFIRLCRLDNQYGFIGGGIIPPEGGTIKIGE